MKHFYLLPFLLLVTLLGDFTRAMGQCAVRPVGADRYTPIDAGTLTACNQSFTDTKNNAVTNCFGNFFDSSQGGFASDDIFYKFTLLSKQKVTISHCGSGFDTYMSLLDVSGNVLAASDDTTKLSAACTLNTYSGAYNEACMQRVLPAGTYYVVSEGYGSGTGPLATTISILASRPPGATMANAINTGTLSSCGATFSDVQRLDATTCFGDDYTTAQPEGRPTDDIYYKFTLTSSAEVSLAHCNTGLAFRGRDPDTYIHLLDANGNHLASNDDYGPVCYSGRSSLRQTLAAGTYYVVSELYNADSFCDLVTTITTSAPPAVAVTAPTTTLAVGGSTTLTASGANAYNWSPATGLSTTTGSSVTAAPTRTTTYTVTGTGSGACSVATTSITIVVSTVPTAPSNPAQDLDRNWAFSRTYDLNGNITGESKQFSDAMGRPTQAQVKNIAAKQVFASQTVLNTGGITVLSTLPAPTYNQEFKYRADFMTVGGTPYSAPQFEDSNANRPVAPDSTAPGTLGYYYSTNNTWEPATAATRSPFSLSEPTPGPLGGMRRSTGPGDKFRMGTGHESKERDFPLLNELEYYSSLRPTFVAGSATTSLRAQGVKVVSVNPNGVESIAFANREGQAVASCLSGDQYPATILSGTLNFTPGNAAGSPVYQDIHIGASAASTSVTVTDGVGGSSFVVIDLVDGTAAERAYSGSQTLALAPGFYRLQATSGQLSFSYAVHYGNFSYAYYDDAGRLIATVAPNGAGQGGGIQNSSFDAEDSGTIQHAQFWQTDGSANAFYTEAYGGGHSGTYHGTHYTGTSAFYALTHQTLTNLTNGRYTLRAWVKGSGTGITSRLLARNYGGPLRSTPIPTTSGGPTGTWTLLEVPDILVSNGQCDVGFESDVANVSYFIYFDDVALIRQPDSSTPTFVTRNTYDTAGRLLSTTNPDEGTTQYVYAKDGRIRFSQSARQVNEDKFSYSNYDAAGRIVESGEYTMARDRTQGVVFESPLANASQRYEAEQAQIIGATVDTSWPGYSGSGAAANIDQVDVSKVQFTFTAPASESYAVEVRYATGYTTTRTLSLYVNGSFLQQVNFAPTGNRGSWAIQTLLLPLAGNGTNNTVEFRRTSADNGGINLDYIQVFYNYNTTATTNSILNASILEDRTRTGGLEMGRCTQRNQVWYDLAVQDAQLGGRTQEFVLGAVAKTSKEGSTTWYSYNDLGQLTWMVQEQPVVGIKTLEYAYDAAGNVLSVAYQKSQSDAFYHHYVYDANQRLTQAFTSPDGTTKTLRASYSYYLHGPLKRVELAGNLQGIDYTYTVQGWLKSINNSQRSLDLGQDGPNASGMFKDLFGMRQDYFDNDYRSKQVAALNPSVPLNQGKQRYDGTLRAASWRTDASTQAYGMGYLYDAKGQLLEADFATVAGGNAFTFSPTRANGEDNLSYDANGNIGSLRRTNSTGVATDNFNYQYLAGTNKLTAVNNPAGTAVLDYDYDATGQMTRQRDEKGQRYYKYDVAGKVIGVYDNTNARQPIPIVTFTYDDRGFRASKASYGPLGQLLRTTYSVRDLQGNEVSTYTQEVAGALLRSEVPLYAASRLGALVRLDDGTVDPRYELNDHLGNARVVFHKPTTVKYTATMEDAVASQEQQDFDNVATTRFTAPGHSGSTKVARLGMSNMLSVGPHKILNVQRGDTLTFTAYAWLTAVLNNVQSPPSNTQASRVIPLVGLTAPLASPMNALPPTSTESERRRAGFNPFARLSLGTAFTLGARQANRTASTSATQLSANNGNARLHYIVRDKSGNPLLDDYQSANPRAAGTWQQLQIGLRFNEGVVNLKDASTIELSVETDGTTNPDVYFDDVQIEQSGGMIVQEQHTYAYGSPLTDRNYVIGTKKYRHGYQGQFAEKDEETGTDDFELRMYDSRIGRWTAPDPKKQYASPYVGMSNNPVFSVDPDGGFAWASILPMIQCYSLEAGAAISKAAIAAAPGALGAGIGAANAAVRIAMQGPGEKNAYLRYPMVDKNSANTDNIVRGRNIDSDGNVFRNASSFFELSDASVSGADVTNMYGSAVENLKNSVHDFRSGDNVNFYQQILNDYKAGGPAYDQRQVRYGPTSKVKASIYESTWVMRNGQLKYWITPLKGNSYKIDVIAWDFFNVTPQPNDKAWYYNIIGSILDPLHKGAAGNPKMQVRASWQVIVK